MITLQLIFWFLITQINFFFMMVMSTISMKKRIISAVNKLMCRRYTYYGIMFMLLFTLMVTIESYSQMYKDYSSVDSSLHITHDFKNARMFRAQRNSYLTTMTLFCSIVNYYIINLNKKIIEMSDNNEKTIQEKKNE